jgi:hypothetical protein
MLTIRQCSTILESLKWSEQKIRDYDHKEYQWKLDSLKPIEDAIAAIHKEKIAASQVVEKKNKEAK